jgi:hypothetical protein
MRSSRDAARSRPLKFLWLGKGQLTTPRIGGKALYNMNLCFSYKKKIGMLVMEMERVLTRKKDKRKTFEVANLKDLNYYVCKFPRLSRNNENVSKKFIQNE